MKSAYMLGLTVCLIGPPLLGSRASAGERRTRFLRIRRRGRCTMTVDHSVLLPG